MTEGNGHVIDPAGEARRALQAAVAEHGPEALSNAVIMDGICQDRLSDLPGEAILIGSATRADVPTLLRNLIPELGNYGAIQSVAATLAEAHGLDTTACLWVVREFARALGLIASGGTHPMAHASPAEGSGQGAAPAPTPTEIPVASAGGAAASEGAGAGEGASSEGRVLNRNTIGVAAAIALVAGYLGVAAVAHLSPFPAKPAAAISSPPASQGNGASSQGNGASSQGNGASSSPGGSPDATPDPTPSSDYQILLSKIPAAVRGTNNCHNIGTAVGANAVSQCSGIHGLPASNIFYYQFADETTLGIGYNNFLTNVVKFKKEAECTNSSNNFVDFITQCESAFTSTTPSMTGSIAEYTNKSNNPIIVTSDDQRHVMVVMVGANDGDLLAYWKQLQWVVT